MNDATTNIIQLGTVKKESIRPADPAIIEASPKPAANEILLVPHEDKILFRCSPKAGAINGAWVVHDGAGTVVALAVNKDIASLLCASVHLYLQAAQQRVDEAKSAETPEQTPTASV